MPWNPSRASSSAQAIRRKTDKEFGVRCMQWQLQLPTLASTEQGLLHMLPSTQTRQYLCDCKCMLELQSLLN